MDDPAAERIRERLRVTFELFDAGVALMRQNLRRRHPDAPDAEIEERLTQWLHHRPGAEFGDSPGVVRPLPERRP
jgi:hypothetical protein